MAHVSEGIVISAGARLTDVIMLLGICFHGNLSVTTTTFEVEPVDFDTQVVLVEASLFPHVKLCAFIQEVTAGFAPNAHRQHHSYIVLLVTGSDHFLQLRVVKVRWIVLV